MTTTEKEKVKRTIYGEITDLATKIGTKGEYAEVSLRERPDQQYATKCRAFDEELVDRFKKARKGMQIGLEIEEQPGTYQGKSITYRNIVGIVAARETPPEPEQASESGGAPQRQPWVDQTPSIEAAWAIDQARQHWQWLHSNVTPHDTPLYEDEILPLAQRYHDAKVTFANAIRSGVRLFDSLQDVPYESPVPVKPADVGEASSNVDESGLGANPELVNPEEIIRWAMTPTPVGLGYLNRQAVFAVKGVQVAFNKNQPQDAINLLQAAKP